MAKEIAERPRPASNGMNILKNGINHHAYLIEGDIHLSYKELAKSLDELGYLTTGNADIFEKDYENLLIDHVREIKDFESEAMNINSKKRFIILKTLAFSYPAQNALLKAFEEPRPGVTFFLLMPDATKLFPTLRSRLMATIGEFAAEDELKKDAKKFLAGSIKERLDFIKKFTDMESKPLLKDKSLRFLGELEKEISRGVVMPEKKKVEDIYLAKKYIGDQGSSPKILLEHLAVTI